MTIFSLVLLLLIAGAALDSLAGAFGVAVLGSVGGSFTNLVGALKIRYETTFSAPSAGPRARLAQ